MQLYRDACVPSAVKRRVDAAPVPTVERAATTAKAPAPDAQPDPKRRRLSFTCAAARRVYVPACCVRVTRFASVVFVDF